MIAIIDDDASVRFATEGLIKSYGFMVQTYQSADEFLKRACLDTISCVVTDMHMPGMNGAELQQHLLSRKVSMPIIVVTAFPSTGLRDVVMANGAVGFLAKPFSGTALIDQIRFALLGKGENACVASRVGA